MFIIILGTIIFAIVLAQALIYKRYWSRSLTPVFRFSTEEAFEGDSAVLHTEIANKKILPLPWLLLEYELSAHLVFAGEFSSGVGTSLKTGLYAVMMYRRVRRKLPFTCAKRGYYRLRRIRLTSSNLLHTQTYNKDISCAASLTVFPKLLDASDELEIFVNSLDAMMLVRSLINPDPFTFRGIREYVPTDPLRSVNFKATAVARQLMVNVHMPASSCRLEIILNLEHYCPAPNDELFEQAIRLAATLANHYIGRDVMVGFYTNGRDVVTGAQMRILPGTQPAQLHAIYRALATVGLAYQPGHISAYLDTLHDRGCVYAVISTYHGEDFIAALRNMNERGLSAAAIVPVHGGMAVTASGENITVWEAIP